MIKVVLDIRFPHNTQEDFNKHFKDLNILKEWITGNLLVNSEKYLKFATGPNNLYYITINNPQKIGLANYITIKTISTEEGFLFVEGKHMSKRLITMFEEILNERKAYENMPFID